MSSIQNKVNIKQNGETVRSLTQNVSMSGDLNGKNGTLMDFIGSFPSADGNSSSLEQKSIFSLVKDENTIKVQIKLPGIFKDKNGASLSENSEIVKDLDNLVLNVSEDNNNMNRPVTFTENHGGLVVKIKSKDGEDYTITSTPTSVSLQYGSTSYTYSTENQHCIDVNMTNDVATGIFSENSELSNYFKTPDSLRNAPSYMFGLYASNLKGTQKIQLGNYTVFSFDFSGENTSQPNIFVAQPDGKLFFFNKGTFYHCKEYFFQYDQVTKEPALVVGTSYNKYFRFAVKSNQQDNQLSLPDDYDQLLTFFKTHDVSYNSKNDVSTKEEDKIKIKCGENVLEFLPEDKRNYEKKIFKVKPETINFNAINAPQPEIPQIFILINNFYDHFVKFYNSHTEYQTLLLDVFKNITSIHEQIELNINAIESMTIETTELNNIIQNFSDKIENIYQMFNAFFNEHSNDPTIINLHDEITNVYNIYNNTYIDKGKDQSKPEQEQSEDENTPDNNGNSGNDNNNENDENKDEENSEQKEEEPEQESEEEKKPPEKIDLKKPIENAGNMSMILGLFFMAAAMIPGVGAIMATIGAIMAGVGAAGVVFADKFVWDPYEKAKREFKDEQQYESLEDDFLENEKNLDLLHEQSAQKFAELDKLIDNDIENGGNLVAKEFKDLYNSYGVGFNPTENLSRFEQLVSMEGFAIRRGIYDEKGQNIIHEGLIPQLKEINLSTNPQQRQTLINKFINENFKEVTQEDRQRLVGMFDPKNQHYLTEFIETFTAAHKAQEKERKLYIDQQMYLGDSDKDISTDRISRLVSYPKLTAEDRKKFFERYGETILKYYSAQNVTSYQQINQLIDRIPAEERKDILEILDRKNKEILMASQNIQKTAEDNVTKVDRINEQQQYATSVNDLTKNAEGYNLMREEEYNQSVETYLQEYTLAYYNNNPSISYMHQMRQGVEKPEFLSDQAKQINQVMINTANSYFAQPNSRSNSTRSRTLYDATSKFYESCKKFGVEKEVGDLYRVDTGLSSILPQPEEKNTRMDCTLQKVATRLANQAITDFESEYTVSDKGKVTDKEGKFVDTKREPLKSQYEKYTQAKAIIETSEELTKLQVPQERGQAKQFAEIEKAVAAADDTLTAQMIKDPANPLNAKYNKLIKEFRKKSPAYISDRQVEALARTKIHLDRLHESATQRYNSSKSPEYNPNYFSQYSALYANVENYMNSYMNGGLNAVFVANAHNHAMGRDSYVYSRESLENAGNAVTTELSRENSVRELIDRFNPKDQEAIRDYIDVGLMAGDKTTSELLIEAIRKNLGSRIVETNSPTYDEYYSSFVRSDLDGQPFDADALEANTRELLNSMEARSQKELSTQEDLLRETHGNFGRSYIAREYERTKETFREQNNPVVEYNSILDILEKRFGVERQKLVEEIENTQRVNPKMSGQMFISSLLDKFGLNKQLFEKSVKSLPKEKQVFDFIKGLSADDKTKIEIIKETRKRDTIREKTELFNGLWANLENGTGASEFVKFFNDKENAEFIDSLNLPYEMIDVDVPAGIGNATVTKKQKQYDIISIIQDSTIDDTERLNRIKEYGAAYNMDNVANNALQKAQIDLDAFIGERMAKTSTEITVVGQQRDFEEFKIDCDNFNYLWNNLKEYPDNQYIKKAFIDFCNDEKGVDFIKNLKINDRFLVDINLLISSDSPTEEKVAKLAEYEQDFDVSTSTQKARDSKHHQIDLLNAKNSKERDLITAKYNLGVDQPIATKFNSLWNKVKESLDKESIDKFIEFLSLNDDFVKKLNLQKSNSNTSSYEIVDLLQTLRDSDDELPIKLRRLEAYENHFKVSQVAENEIKSEEDEIEILDAKAQATSEEEVDMMDNENRLKNFDNLQKDLSENLSAIINLDPDVYTENDLTIAMNAFINGDYNTLSKFNIDYKGIQFVDYKNIIAKLEEIGDVDTLKYKGKVKKAVINSLEKAKKQIKKVIGQIKKLFEKLSKKQTSQEYSQIINEIAHNLQLLRNNIYNAMKSAEEVFGKKLSASPSLTDSQIKDNLAINAEMLNSRAEKERKRREQLENEALEREAEEEKAAEEAEEKDGEEKE